MKSLLVGTVKFSKSALQKIIDLNMHPSGVITKNYSLLNADYADLRPICHQHDIDYLRVNNIHEKKVINWIIDKKPDVIFCFGWSYLLKKDILSIPRLGAIGFHPTAMPHNRGRHPLIWALALGLTQTEVSGMNLRAIPN